MPEFTRAQTRAIEEDGRTLLISAAAGSGKTTTLIERIIRSVCRKDHPIPLDRLLIVTFTRAAAAELRLRISRALTDALAKSGNDPFLARQVTLLPSAKIGTIDSFYLDLVRRNYAALGLSPAFRIADAGEAALIAREQMEALIDDCYDDRAGDIAGGTVGFAALANLLCGTKDDNLADILLSLAEKLDAYPRGAAALFDREDEMRVYAAGDFFACPLGARIEREVRDVFLYMKERYAYVLALIRADEKLSLAYDPAFSEDYAGILRMLNALDTGYAAAFDAIRSIGFSRLGSYRQKDNPHPSLAFIKSVREDYKDTVKGFLSGWFATDAATLADCLFRTADAAHAIGGLLCEYERRARLEKQRRGVCDFADITRYALSLLTDADDNDTPLADTMKEAYDAIYIDEYQDVNAVQDRIFRAIAKPDNRFMVGDIKQSIYGFRGAEAAIFAGLRSSFAPIDDAAPGESATIFMSENFRCSREVVDFTNLLFARLMPAISPETGYTEGDALIYGKRGDRFPVPVQFFLCEKPPKDAPDAGRPVEAERIADEIEQLVRYGEKQDGSRIRYGDVALLFRSLKGTAADCSAVLRARGIPVETDAGANLLDAPEIQILVCLLETIDNPRRDISLAGVLLSPLCGVSYDRLALLRRRADGKRLYETIRDYLAADDTENADADDDRARLAAFFADLAQFRAMARCLRAPELIEEICDRLAYVARVCGADRLRRANVERLIEAARGAASGGRGSLSDFLRYLRRVEADAKTPLAAAKPDGSAQDAIHIMTIHQSKGLEYPVVFLADAGKTYNTRDADASPIYSAAGGFGLRLRDESGFCLYDNLVRKSVSLAVRDRNREEELRLLYVALTRARERLYITATLPDPEKAIALAEIESRFTSPYVLRDKQDFLSLALIASRGEHAFVETHTVRPGKRHGDAAVQEKTPAASAPAPDAAALRALSARLSFRYPHEARTKIPAKIAVSLLYPDILDDTLSALPIDEDHLPPMKETPRFLADRQSDAARRGTATHLFMQFFDFAYAAKNGAAAELRRLCDARFLTPEDAALVNLPEVETFLRSPLFAKMRAAKRIFREQRFNLRLCAADFATDRDLRAALADEHILVQGVIDCFFYDEKGNIILVDYKTDRLHGGRAEAEQELRQKHARQLGYYAKAVEALCGKLPACVLLYSLALGGTVAL